MSRRTTTGPGWPRVTLLGVLAIAACAPAYAPAGVEVLARRPPVERVEVRGGPPGLGYVWINGHYAWQRGDYLWVGGRWEAPPQPRYRHWTSGHWVHVRQGWYWVEGRWH